MSKSLVGRVAIVTGAGAGLGRSHALALARAGARVLVNDLGAAAAAAVVDDIRSLGGEALANDANVTDIRHVEAMVEEATAIWGRVDILVNNAGVLVDRTFAKMTLDEFRLVLDVHLMGSVYCTKAVWKQMCNQNYGRIVLTTSSSGLYGNFGQANYSTAKMALVGLMQTLSLEGARKNIRVNCLAPSAATKMTAGLYSEEALEKLSPDSVSPAVIALAREDAPTRTILLAGAGNFSQAHITMTRGIFLGDAADAADQIVMRLEELADRKNEAIPATGAEQYQQEIAQAGL